MIGDGEKEVNLVNDEQESRSDPWWISVWTGWLDRVGEGNRSGLREAGVISDNIKKWSS